MKLWNQFCGLLGNAYETVKQQNHRLAEENRIKASISRAEQSRERAYLSLGKYYYATGSADEHSRVYFERIERASKRMQKGQRALRARTSARKAKREKPAEMPRSLRLEYEMQAAAAQVQRETGVQIFGDETPPKPVDAQSQELLRTAAAGQEDPAKTAREECALESDGNIPWD